MVKAASMRLSKAAGSKKAALAIGVTAMVVFAGSVVFGLNATHGMPLAPRTTVLAAFDEVGGLVDGDDVRIASSRVGYVEEIRIENGQAVTVLQIDDEDKKFYRNATASIEGRSALGQKFVNLNPGTPDAGELPAGQLIEQRQTRGAQEISELFNTLDGKTRRSAGSAVRELGGGMAGHSQDLRDAVAAAPQILPDLGTVSRTLSAHNGADLTGLLRSAETLASRFQGREQEIAGLTRKLGTTMDAVAVDGGAPVEAALQRSPEALRAARTAMDALASPLADTETAMTNLRPGAGALGAATEDLRAVLREGVAPLEKVPGVAEKADPAVEGLTHLMTDARPVSARLVNTTNDAAKPLSVLAPYSGEVSNYFTVGTNALSHGDESGHWLRIYLIPRLESASGTVPIEDPTVSRNAYPAPGEAANDAAPSPLEGGRR